MPPTKTPATTIDGDLVNAPRDEPRRVFITGALGFIGRTLAARYRSLGAEVRGVDLVADADAGVAAADITATGGWQRAMVGCDLVVHTAAVVSNAGSFETFWRLNVLGTRLVLDAAAAAGVGRVVHLSSVRAFSDLGFPDGVGEHHPVRTDGNPYVDTKVAGEQVVLQAHAAGEVPCTIVRPGDVYGPGSRPWTVLPVQAIKANRFLLPAMGKGIFSPVYVDDLVDGVLLAAATPAAAGRVYTLTGDTGVSCKEFFGHYCRMLGRSGPVCVPTPVALALARGSGTVDALRRRESEANAATVRYFTRRGTYSNARARRELGFRPATGLVSGMRRTETWLRDQGLV